VGDRHAEVPEVPAHGAAGPWLADDLRAYLTTQPRADDPSAPLFPARYGRNAPGVSRAAATDPDTYNWAAPVDPGTLYASYFRPAVAAVGLDPTRLHDLATRSPC
jgi:integrase